MTTITISNELKHTCPNLHIGCITYHHIVIESIPQMIERRMAVFFNELKLALENKNVSDIDGVSQFRKIFKAVGTDPSRYRPSQEALFRRVKKSGELYSVNSAVDINNFFSLHYEIPIGIYDLKQIHGDIQLRIGDDHDTYEGLNGRVMSMKNKITSGDERGAFGSPIVDSKRTMVTEKTTDALALVYLKPAMQEDEAHQLLQAMRDMFIQVHGGDASYKWIK
ncbi:B3/B4 domain-containing protein [Terrilactibacillus laevilacticus]|uniref:B3/B4 domain-containing protein n=1 Tax=Terrilactibacillus laevilacticus TaxID=1380157 RepID=UPI001147A5F1|nr:phenylalanine--tRNA ligase beta subunit-related protein [Terrilactibacillus laevilacticus]